MAGNKKIFDLPLRTGVTSDDRLALVDSGNTTTYSVKVSDIQGGAGVSTLNTLTGALTLAAGTNMTITDNGTDTITFDASGGGGGKYIAADGTNNIVPDYYPTTSIGSGQIQNAIVGGFSGNTISGIDSNQVIIGGTGQSLSGGNNSVIVGGSSNTKSNGLDGGIFAGNANTISSSQQNNVVLGGNNNSITGGLRAFIIGGQNNSHTSNYGGVLGGQGNTSSERGYAIGGNNSNIGQDACGIGTMNFSVVNRQNSDNSGHIIAGGRFHSCNTNNAQRQTFLGGYQNKIYASSPSEGMVHIGGADNWIGGGTFASPTQVVVNHAYIANSKSSQISGGTQNAIINSTGSTLNAGTTNTTIIGCNGVAGDVSDSVYVPALILANYASYNYASDSAAATGGVPLGGIYHNAGDLKVRIT